MRAGRGSGSYDGRPGRARRRHGGCGAILLAVTGVEAGHGPWRVDLYWLPLGAGGHSVRLNGLLFEAVAARLQRRARRDLYHSALIVTTPDGAHAIEMTPVPSGDGAARGVVAEGPVGWARAGSLRILRYEIRCWRGGVIPDLAEAVESPQRMTGDPDVVRRLLDLAPSVPTPTWGRDELRAGEMWNSNSVLSWLLQRSGVDLEDVHPPAGGRAPGWQAGLVVAARTAGATRRGAAR